ncbi:hypothetical protein M409DRAFT_22252 [Zasmidium cellare ATCC 36951]|uniref:Uncharacterized protein n=1 Tax=Zasmidium cellare ATCC 36951 TaxID=1080233 RepID=A0A6A6CJP0_ZASCE|nr:uncharacterized protein M409DRAFT_22252 [Zasmidium cellare ATCC 36951]KAF2167444.1 hypothetical protein M409DRAFT_22252 [Zasmidium cellare ATCC 36951]
MEMSGDLEIFREQLLASAAVKKGRQQARAIQHQQALESKALRNASPLSPKLFQDAMDLAIAAAVPDFFEIKILRRPRDYLSLMDGSQDGQVLLLDRLVSLMSLNRDCYASVIREENTLDSMLRQNNSRHCVLAHAATIQVEALLVWDFRIDEPPPGLFPPTNRQMHEVNYPNRPFGDRYMRRYTATLRRRDRDDLTQYDLADSSCERWSLSQPIDHHDQSITRIFAWSAWSFYRELKLEPLILLPGKDRFIPTIWHNVDAAFHSSYLDAQKDCGVALSPPKCFCLIPAKYTRKLFEHTEHLGYWEEDEMWKAVGV